MDMASKDDLRRVCIARMRRAAAHPNRYVLDKRVAKRLDAFVKRTRARRIMAYIPMPIEANIFPLLQRWRQEGIALYVPFMEGESFRLVKYKYPLKRKRFGIKEPKNATKKEPKTIDIAIVPVVAVDGNMRRIGFGKGMYDRFFTRYGRRIGRTVFVSRRACYTSKPVCDDYDISADAIITGK